MGSPLKKTGLTIPSSPICSPPRSTDAIIDWSKFSQLALNSLIQSNFDQEKHENSVENLEPICLTTVKNQIMEIFEKESENDTGESFLILSLMSLLNLKMILPKLILQRKFQ